VIGMGRVDMRQTDSRDEKDCEGRFGERSSRVLRSSE
jgi:hypothetical protein